MNAARLMHRFVLIAGTIVVFSIPSIGRAEDFCCKCAPQNMTDPPTLCYTTPTLKNPDNCGTLPDEANMQGISCEPKKLTAAQCKKISAGGICTAEPESAKATRKGDTVSSPNQNTVFPSMLRNAVQLNTPIPGFTPPTDMGLLFGTYITALYRYMISIGVFLTTVMFIWGAFRYLVGSGLGSVARGKQIMKDAVIGMILLFASNLILRTINPALVTFKTVNIEQISTKFLEEIPPDSATIGTGKPTVGGAKADCLVSNFGGTDQEVKSKTGSVTFLGDKYIVQQSAVSDFQAAFQELEQADPNTPQGKWVQHMKNMPSYNGTCGKKSGYSEAGSRTGGSYIERLDRKVSAATTGGSKYCYACDLHALALAIDLDSCFNPMCPSGQTCTLTDTKYNTIPKEVVDIFAKHKVYWGGYGWTSAGLDWNNAVPRRDAMHFEWHGICW